MKKKIMIVLVICLGVAMQGCTSGEAPKTTKKQSTNTTSAASNINPQSTIETENQKVSNNDYSKYSGNWVTESSLKSDFKYGTTVTLKVDKEGNLTGIVGSSTENASHVSNVDIKGKIQNNEFTYKFKDDNWGHNGTVTLKFQNDNVVLNLAYGPGSSKNDAWGIGEGTFTLVKDTTKVNRTLNDLKNGGLLVIENQCFNVNLKNYGEVKFISGLKRENSSETVQFYLLDKNNNVLYKFNDFYGNPKGRFKDISAVSFSDINNDGAKDIIVIANYYTAESSQFPIGSIYFSKGKEFINDKNLDDKINKSKNNNSISSLIKFAKENIKK